MIDSFSLLETFRPLLQFFDQSFILFLIFLHIASGSLKFSLQGLQIKFEFI